MTKCKICNSSALSEYIKFKDRVLIKCNSCGIVFDKDIDNLDINYEDGDKHIYWNKMDEYYHRFEQEYKAHIKIIKKYIKTGKALEIGCGRGHFLKTLRQEGYEVTGIETSGKNVGIARNKYSLNIINEDIYEYDFSDARFDIIVLWGVIEHLKDLNKLSEIINKLLNKGGILIINTQVEDWKLVPPFKMFNKLIPSLGSPLGHLIYDSEHVYFFCSSFLENYFSQIRFQLLKRIKVETVSFKYLYKYYPIYYRPAVYVIRALDILLNSYRKEIFIFKKGETDSLR